MAKKGFKSEEKLQINSEYLQKWKAQIHKHQHQMRLRQLPEQVMLFDLDNLVIDPEAIDPFSLTLHSFSFFRLPASRAGIACIYFVMDSAAEIILYIGETCQSNKRWIGHNDCKRYLDKYKDLHYQHGLSCAINMAFWWDAPVKTRRASAVGVFADSKIAMPKAVCDCDHAPQTLCDHHPLTRKIGHFGVRRLFNKSVRKLLLKK